MDDIKDAEDIEQTFWVKHSFLLLIGISIATALVLVVISMELYTSSGAAQLDLSRPGYKAVTSQAVQSDNDFQDYQAFGTLDSSAVNDFKTLYEKEADKAKAVDAFSGDPLDPAVLEISAAPGQ
jgi:hypothetical protein